MRWALLLPLLLSGCLGVCGQVFDGSMGNGVVGGNAAGAADPPADAGTFWDDALFVFDARDIDGSGNGTLTDEDAITTWTDTATTPTDDVTQATSTAKATFETDCDSIDTAYVSGVDCVQFDGGDWYAAASTTASDYYKLAGEQGSVYCLMIGEITGASDWMWSTRWNSSDSGLWMWRNASNRGDIAQGNGTGTNMIQFESNDPANYYVNKPVAWSYLYDTSLTNDGEMFIGDSGAAGPLGTRGKQVTQTGSPDEDVDPCYLYVGGRRDTTCGNAPTGIVGAGSTLGYLACWSPAPTAAEQDSAESALRQVWLDP